MLSDNSLRQTVHIYHASVHQAAKLVTALLRVAGVTAGLAESNGGLLPGLWLTAPAGWLPRTGISSGTLRSAIKYELPYLTPGLDCNCRFTAKHFFLVNASCPLLISSGSPGPSAGWKIWTWYQFMHAVRLDYSIQSWSSDGNTL